ncbi:MAG: DinB family protein [Chloroflexi bacterium]|nr:DinB family protein [Chloroflexota bacterium]
MELIDFAQTALQGSQRAIKRATDGLTAQELAWQPKPDANSIGLILFHNARSEDTFIQSTIQQTPTEWEAGKWHSKLGMLETQPGAGYTQEQVATFRAPALADLLAYADAVRAKTTDYVKGLTPAKCDQKVTWGRTGEFTIGALLALVINHSSQHAGEVSYLRGLQRGANK